jgi:hypothetical protein
MTKMGKRRSSANNQAELFGSASAPAYTPDSGKVRASLQLILGEVRAATTMPWRPVKLSLYKTIFPQMSTWLPEDEAKQLCFEFETEMARLEAA